ncbi:MAG: hypothetical protein C0507_18950 [Cyanobacteria bacterium PR.3.49]|nr:hypothetical protein [Cyanobacteria bacterium PR.3.49]
MKNRTSKISIQNLNKRNQKGNILLLILACMCLIIVPLLLVASQGGLYAIDRDRARSAVEAAALLAANDMSRVIVEDPAFGYVSLSNFPPNGEGTLARDGEPLPVTGINTLTGTIRQLAVLGQEIQNDTIIDLAETDRKCLESTIDNLNMSLAAAVRHSQNGNARQQQLNIRSKDQIMTGDLDLQDSHGQKIEIRKDVSTFLDQHLPPSLKLESIELENGWLACPSRSSIALPNGTQFQHVEKGQSIDGEYRAFVNVPFQNQEFTFAGVGKSSALVSTADFKSGDDKHINSIVRVKATFVRNNSFTHVMPFGLEMPDKIEIAAAAQPFTMDDTGPAGIMMLRFGGGAVAGLQSWRDFLQKSNFHDRQAMAYQAVRGDYPADPCATMRPSKLDAAKGASQQFSEHLYYWLRNGHLRPKLASVLEMLSQTFQSAPNSIYAYEFNNNGNISRRVIARDPFPRGFTSEEQVSTTVDTNLNSGINPIIIFRNNVKRLGKDTGGKHAGQPVAGNPLNWCELSEYGGDDFIAGAVRKGRLATGLTLLNPNDGQSMFRGFDGKTICLQPRKSYYSGGLAVDIEIGGLHPQQSEPDAASISQVKAGRGGFSRR